MRCFWSLGICAFGVLGLSGSTYGTTNWQSISGHVIPASPRQGNTVTVGAYGVWPDSCIPIYAELGVYPGNEIYIDFYDDPLAYPYCYGVPTDFGIQDSNVLPVGRYTVYASVWTNMAWFPYDPPQWEETTGPVYLTAFLVAYIGDINRDGAVNIMDLGILGDAWATCQGDAGYDAACDLNGDSCIDVVDLLTLADNWGKSV